MRIKYILVDYESVQPTWISELPGEDFRVLLLVGSKQNKIAFDIAAALQRLGSRAEYIKISSCGPNALDFHIAYYIGALAQKDPKGHFYIISKDTGFDPLIKHLAERKIKVTRSDCLPTWTATAPSTHADKLAAVTARLASLGAKPKTPKSLSSLIASVFQKKIPKSEVESLVGTLQKQGVIQIHENKVVYPSPST